MPPKTGLQFAPKESRGARTQPKWRFLGRFCRRVSPRCRGNQLLFNFVRVGCCCLILRDTRHHSPTLETSRLKAFDALARPPKGRCLTRHIRARARESFLGDEQTRRHADTQTAQKRKKHTRYVREWILDDGQLYDFIRPRTNQPSPKRELSTPSQDMDAGAHA